MKPAIPLTKWPLGQYVPSHATDIRRTFAKERARIERERGQTQGHLVILRKRQEEQPERF